MAGIAILTAATNGNGAAIAYDVFNKRQSIETHKYTLYIFGTHGGSTVTFEVSHDGTTFVALPGVSSTIPEAFSIEFAALEIRGVVTGGTAEAVDMVLMK